VATMGSTLSNIHDQEEGFAWDVQWTQLEQGGTPAVQLAPSSVLSLGTRRSQWSSTAEMMDGAHRRERKHAWDVRWSELEQDLSLKVRRETMATMLQQKLQQPPTLFAQETGKEKDAKATEFHEGFRYLGEEAIVSAVVRAAGA